MRVGGRAFLNMLTVFAEFEVDLIRERIMLGLEKARREGEANWQISFENKISKEISAN